MPRKGDQGDTPMLFQPLVESSDIPAIPGLRYFPEYISKSEEAELVMAIDAAPWDTTWDRRRQPYGATYGDKPTVELPIPEWGQSMSERIFKEGLTERPFNQMLVNEYLPGQGIAMHRDYEPFDRTVVSLSLLSPCVMDFRRGRTGPQKSLLLEPRSLLLLSDEARYEWEHGIARRKVDPWHGLRIPRGRRLSITFRAKKLT